MKVKMKLKLWFGAKTLHGKVTVNVSFQGGR